MWHLLAIYLMYVIKNHLERFVPHTQSSYGVFVFIYSYWHEYEKIDLEPFQVSDRPTFSKLKICMSLVSV
jgi:hypothetical protein